MDRIWQWAWDRYGTRYSWAMYAIALPFLLQPYLITSFLVVAFEGSGRYVEAAAVSVVQVVPSVLASSWGAGPPLRD